MREQHPDLPITEITKIVGKEWNELPEEKKAVYLKVAETRYQQWVREMEEYCRQHPEKDIKVPGTSERAKRNHAARIDALNKDSLAKSAASKNPLAGSTSEENNDNYDEDEVDDNNHNDDDDGNV